MVRDVDRQECLIKWKGFGAEHNSWVPREHVTTVEYLIESYDDGDEDYNEKWTMPNEKKGEVERKQHHYHTRTKKKQEESLEEV